MPFSFRCRRIAVVAAGAAMTRRSALADGLGRRTGLPVERCLARRDTSARQVGAGRAQRTAPGRLRFAVVRLPVPQRVLLVDDVHTTGATLEACAAVLRANGSAWIAAVTYARTL